MSGCQALWYSGWDLPVEEVDILRRNYFEQYGTTLRGLQIHHQVDTDEYLAYVHDLPLEKLPSALPRAA